MPKVFNTDQIENILTRVRDSIGGRPIITLSHIKDGNIHRLNGLDGLTGLVPAVFIATDNFVSGDTFTVDGVEYNAQMSDGGSVPNNIFTTASTMVVVLNTTEKKFTFKSSDTESGGLGDDQLTLATATTDQVFLDQTFYAGDSTLKTGTFDLSLANATAAQVLSGYKFYAGNNVLKTGTLVPTPKIRTGRFRDDGSELTISCGFKPVCVMLYGDPFYNGIHFGVWSYNGRTVGSYFRSSSGYIYWDSYDAAGLISITNQGFSVDSSQWRTPYEYDTYFIAIG